MSIGDKNTFSLFQLWIVEEDSMTNTHACRKEITQLRKWSCIHFWCALNSSLIGNNFSNPRFLSSWKNAQSECQKSGGNLLSIHDEKKQTFVEELMLDEGLRSIWIGLKDEPSDVWMWSSSRYKSTSGAVQCKKYHSFDCTILESTIHPQQLWVLQYKPFQNGDTNWEK